jgi:hypothetical protein
MKEEDLLHCSFVSLNMRFESEAHLHFESKHEINMILEEKNSDCENRPALKNFSFHEFDLALKDGCFTIISIHLKLLMFF